MKILITDPNNQYIAGYEFSYIKGDGLRRDLLNVVRRRNQHGERLNEIVVSWNDQTPHIEEVGSGIHSLDLSGYWSAGDINGDGISDVVNVTTYQEPGAFKPKKLLITAQISFLTHKGIEYGIARYEDECPDSFGMPFIINSTQSDQKTVMIPICKDKTWSLQPYYYTSSGLEKKGTRPLFLETTDSDLPVTFTVGDLNNDGLDDFVISCGYIKQNDLYYGRAYVFLQSPIGGFFRQEDIEWHHFPEKEGSQADQIYIADFNKDGLSDLAILTHKGLFLYENISSLSSFNQSVTLRYWNMVPNINSIADVIRGGDFNGDGLLDFIYCSSRTRQWKLAINQGDWTFVHSDIPARVIDAYEEPIKDNDNKEVFYAYDFNNDGLCDFVYWDAEYTDMEITKNKGRITSYKLRFLESKATYFECVKEETALVRAGDDPHRNMDLIGDFNGDGAAEYIGYFSHGMTGYSQPIEKTYHVVSAISSGMNQKVYFDYQPLARRADLFYTPTEKRAAYPVTDVCPPLICVKTMTTESPGQDRVSIEYAYGGAKYHQIVGFLGFERISAINSLTAIKDVTINSYNEKGWLVQTSELQSRKEQMMNETISKYTHVIRNDGARFSYISQLYEKNHLKLTECTVQNIYDTTKGYLLKQVRTFDDNITMTEDYGSFVLNKPTVIQRTSSYPDESEIIETTTYRYDERGNLSEKNEYASTPQCINTQYGNYSVFGSPGFEKITAGDYILTQYYKYDLANRLSEKEDFLGKTIYQYDELTGNLLSVETPDGLKEIYQYDLWGKIISYTDWSGVTTIYTTEWDLENPEVPSIIKEIKRRGTLSPEITWYDALRRKCKTENIIRGNLLAKSVKSYDKYGNLKSESGWLGNILTKNRSYEYDDFNRMIRSIDRLTEKAITYNYAGRICIKAEKNVSSLITYDSQGNMTGILNTSGGLINYHYNSQGLPVRIKAPNAEIEMSYDIQGNKTGIKDLLSGEERISEYDALGHLIYERDTEGNEIRISYDQYGRIERRYINNEVDASYEYVSEGNGLGKVRAIYGADSNIYQKFNYDAKGRMSATRLKLSYDIDPIVFLYTYDFMGNLVKTVYPGNKEIYHIYVNNELQSVRYDYTQLWNNVELNAGWIKNSYGNGIVSVANYDKYGNLSGITATRGSDLIIEDKYDFDPMSGLLRERYVSSINEAFTYDNLQRLTLTEFPSLGNDSVQQVRYKSNLIDYKSGCGQYEYSGTRPIAIIPDEFVSSDLITGADSLAYTSFGSIKYISRGTMHAEFAYGPDHRRIFMKQYKGNILQNTIYYAGLYEIHIDDKGNKREICYIKAANDMPAMLVTENSITKIYYLHADHLGSITAVSDEEGKIIARYHYDPWGIKQQVEGEVFPLLTRGFTGHEELSHFGLINMNGRLYDPRLGVFLSEDNFIQLADNAQNYNRYTYCLNNPLHLTDRSGELFGLDDIVVAAIAVGVIAGTANVIANWENINGFWQGFTSFFVAAGTAVATVYTGGMAGGSWAAAVSVGTIGGGINGATNSIIAQTGKNFDGMDKVDWEAVSISSTSGMVSSAVSSGIGYYCAVNPKFALQGFELRSSVAKSITYSILPSVGGHVAGGMTGNLLAGESWEDAWENTIGTLGESLTYNILTSAAVATGVSVGLGRNPFTDRPLKSGYPSKDYVGETLHKEFLQKGEIIDRYGSPSGKYASPHGTPFQSRGLAPVIEFDEYNVYRVQRPILVDKSIVAPAFGQPGGGIQYKFAVPLKKFIDQGSLIKIK